jgi:hypothetical protein
LAEADRASSAVGDGADGRFFKRKAQEIGLNLMISQPI